jgi:hypothetical protein
MEQRISLYILLLTSRMLLVESVSFLMKALLSDDGATSNAFPAYEIRRLSARPEGTTTSPERNLTLHVGVQCIRS